VAVSIQEIIGNIKRFFGDYDVLIGLVLLAVSISSLMLGRMSLEGESALNVTQNKAEIQSAVSEAPTEFQKEPNSKIVEQPELVSPVKAETTTENQYVASKNGTKYHLPWCAGAQQIKEENKIWFDSKDEAERAGYTPASNCKGI
jgi:hypothetical protein